MNNRAFLGLAITMGGWTRTLRFDYEKLDDCGVLKWDSARKLWVVDDDFLSSIPNEYSAGVCNALEALGYIATGPGSVSLRYLTPSGVDLLHQAFDRAPQYFDDDPKEVERG